MSFSRLWLFLAVALPVLASLIAPLSTVDLAYNLRAGAEILDKRAIPTVDTWTFTIAGQPWFDQQWGAQVVLAVVERLGGWTALAMLRAALVGAIVAGLLVIVRHKGLTSRTAALLVLAAFIVMSPALALRPQLLGMGCFVLLLLVVADRRDHPTRMWFAVPIVIAWANLHGSFFLGPVVLGLTWLQDVHDRDPGHRRTLLVAVVSTIATCVTPFGPLVWVYAAALSVDPDVIARVTEWQPTSLRDVPGILFFASVAGVATLIARQGRAVAWPTLVWLGVFVAIGLYAQRGLAWWPLAAVPAIAGTLIAARPDTARAHTPMMARTNAGLAAVIVAAVLVVLPVWRPQEPGTGAPSGLLADAPADLTAALQKIVRPGDRMLAPQHWSSWFEYAMPDVLQAVDSRIELFPSLVWSDYEAILAGQPGWEALLLRWNVTFVVIEAGSLTAKERLIKGGWTVRHVDEEGSVLSSPGR